MITLLYDNFQLVSMYINFLTFMLKRGKKYFPPVFLHLVGLGSFNIFIAFFLYSITWPTHTMFAYPRFFSKQCCITFEMYLIIASVAIPKA